MIPMYHNLKLHISNYIIWIPNDITFVLRVTKDHDINLNVIISTSYLKLPEEDQD